MELKRAGEPSSYHYPTERASAGGAYRGSEMQGSFSDEFSSSSFSSEDIIPAPHSHHLHPHEQESSLIVGGRHSQYQPQEVSMIPDDPGKSNGEARFCQRRSTIAESSKEWDAFKLLPPKPDRRGKGVFYDFCLQLLKLSTFVVLFVITLSSAILAKTSFLLMTSGFGKVGQNVSICADKIPEAKENFVFISGRNAAKWGWAVFLSLCVPELFCFVQSFHKTMFRTVRRPTPIEFFFVFFIETIYAVGSGVLAFEVMPQMPVFLAVMLSNVLCFIPSIVSALSREPSRWLIVLIFIDIGAIGSQSTVLWALPGMLDDNGDKVLIIGCCVTMVSLAWWQNYVSSHAFLSPIRWIANFSARLHERRSKTYVFISLWKCVVYMLCMFYLLSQRIPIENFLRMDVFDEQLITITARGMNRSQIEAFQDRMQDFERMSYKFPIPAKKNKEKKVVEKINVDEWAPPAQNTTTKSTKTSKKEGILKTSKSIYKKPKEKQQQQQKKGESVLNLAKRSVPNSKNLPVGSEEEDDEEEEEQSVSAYNIYEDFVEMNQFTTPQDSLWMALFQAFCAMLCYQSAQFACKVMMQRLGFALPMTLSVPLTLCILSNICAERLADPCYMTYIINKELFWQCPTEANFPSFWAAEFWTSPFTILWMLWFLSQFWITAHLWTPKHERLANSEKLFVLSYYNGLFVDQSIALNRRRDDKIKIRYEDLEMDMDDADNDSQRAFRTAGGPPFLCSVSSSKVDSGLIRDAPSSTDSVSKIYVCATMWHESSVEQFNLLKSLFRLDEDQSARRNAQKYLKVLDPDYYEFEAHIFFDDAFEIDSSGEPTINKFVRQLIEKINEAASAVHQTHIELKRPKKCSTPYGGCFSYILPGKNRLIVHLKDKNKIRQRKRWSQVMYLYYLLGYRLMLKVGDKMRRDLLAENTYILTLDGDVDFVPECVHLLVDLMKKNRRLGAACGRIHPRGSGLMIWYQKFEYAVGHWLQKATEHMIGCVLCSPGCFSLFRSYALMDDNVARRYATKSDKPVHYIQYDQGEDRWLCTLLLQRGYRVEYCAASDALTFAPEGFNEFFNQRRRWIPSTLANIIDLLRDYRNVVSVNESISIWYIIYQFIMLVSSILGPGTIFLMIVGAISISFNIETRLALIIVTAPVLCFCICSLTCKTDKQLLLAQIIGALFAMLMTAVIVGTSIQIQKDGVASPHAVFLFTVLGSFTIAAILHPLEFTCAIPFFLYFLAIPCMYMLLPIYSLANLNTVSWGTREDPSISNRSRNGRRKDESNTPEDTMNGEVSVGCGSLCRLVCCVHEKPAALSGIPSTKESAWNIGEGLREISRKLDTLEMHRSDKTTKANSGQKQSVSGNSSGERRQDAVEQQELDEINGTSEADGVGNRHAGYRSESWLNDKLLRNFDQYYLDAVEESFWIELINRYLQPIAIDSKEQERIQQGLTELRNKTCSAFFMINAVFIIVVLVLQMQKDCLYIEWPFGPKVNHTVTMCHPSENGLTDVWVLSRLQLEPISLVFLVFFMSILIIQVLAMLMHRFGTLAHIIASTELFCFRKRADKLSEEDLVVQNAVEIARELQAIRGVDQIRANPGGINSENTIGNPRRLPRQELHPVETLDAAFKKRFFSLSSASMNEPEAMDLYLNGGNGKLTLNRNTIKALEQRRDSIYKARGEINDKKYSRPTIFSSDSEDQSLEGAARCRATSPPFNLHQQPQPSYVAYTTHRSGTGQFRLDQLFDRN